MDMVGATQENATVVLPAGPAAIDAQALAAAQPDAVRTQSSAAAGAQVASDFRPTNLTIFKGPGRTCAKGKEHKVKRKGRQRKNRYLSYVEGDAGEVSYLKNGKLWTLRGKIFSGGCCLNYPASLTVGDVTYPLITPPFGKGYFRFLGDQMLLILDGKIWAFNF